MSRVSRFLPNLNWLLAIVPSTLVVIITALDRDYQYDIWHHLARGRAMVEQGRIINEDIFTFTVSGQTFQDVNWLSQLLFYRVYLWGGLDGVQLFNSLVLAGMMGLLVHLCWHVSGSLRLACLLGIFTFFGLAQMMTVRPQSFSLFLFILLYDLLVHSERRPWLLAFPPLIMMAWVNLHGAFPIGVFLIGAFLLAAGWDAWRKLGRYAWKDRYLLLLSLCLAASLLALLVNPYGWEVYRYVGVTSSRASNREIMEWLPAGLKLFIGKMWVLSLLLLIISITFRARIPTARDLILILLFLPLSCGAVRMIGWWFLISAPIIAAQLAAVLPRSWVVSTEPEQPSLVADLAVLMIVLLTIISIPGLDKHLPIPSAYARERLTDKDLTEAADQLVQVKGPGGRLYARFEWGEYLSWYLAPAGYTVFMDARIEVYPDQVWDDYQALLHGRADWEEILDRYGVDCMILDLWHTHQAKWLLPQVEKSPRWTEIWRSEESKTKPMSVVFVRKPQ